jgi:PAS domain S-box-containing protein/diguanylate cyclase (GGDEF)-like protein
MQDDPSRHPGTTGLATLPPTSSAEAHELLRALTRHTPYGIFRSDAEGKCVYVNDRWCELSGLSPEQALGDGWIAALHPEDLARVLDEWGDASRDGRDSTVEYRFLRPDGGISWIEGFATSLHGEQTAGGWVGICLDLTAKKQADEALLRAGERFRMAFENAPIGVALVDPSDARWLQVNRALCDLLGYSELELLRMTSFDVTHPDDLAATRAHWERLQASDGEVQQVEQRYVRADGRVVSVSISGTLVRDSAGEPLYTIAQIADVSERRATQEALEEAEERFRRAFDDAPIGFALVGLDGRWLRVNRVLCELTGWAESELLERRFQDITHADDLEADNARVARLIAGEIPMYQAEKRYLRPDGRPVWVALSVSLVRDAEGVPLYFVSQIQGIGERRRAHRELERLAHHDSLTGLRNRRKLTTDLARALEPDASGSFVLAIFDLNGFKRYNDSFGHPAGDVLLQRLAHRLERAAGPNGRAYRLGGDEFCLLAQASTEEAEALIEDALDAFAEAGEGFAITSSVGVVLLPEEAVDPDAALRLADERLYVYKQAFQSSRRDGSEVLRRLLAELKPSLREHMDAVAELSIRVGSRLGLHGERLQELRLAAELHDIGKLAIPDAVLGKPGPLDAEEWALVREHTRVAQRILEGAPQLRSVGEIVRATHERWDGAGYVDALATGEIPLAARIISVCDAYTAMISDRPYRKALSHAEALAELRRCAFSQFDPEIVQIFCAELEAPRPERPAERVATPF